MSFRLKCGNCGKAALAGSEDAGHRILCRACGRWIAVPPVSEWLAQEPAAAPEAVSPAEPDPEQPGDEQVSPDEVVNPPQLMEAVRELEAEKTHAEPARPRIILAHQPQPNTASRLVLAATIVGFGLIVWGLVSMLFFQAPDPWEQANAPKLASLKAEAESLVKEGRFADAHTLYQQIQEEVGGRAIRDEPLRQLVDAARAAQERVFLALIDQARMAGTNGSGAPTTQSGVLAQDQPPEPVIDFTPPPATQRTQVAIGPVTPPPESIATVEPVKPPETVTNAGPPKIVRPPRPPVRPIAMPTPDITDEQIGESIKKGVDYLLRQFQNGQYRGGERGGMDAGMNVLTVYALIQCGQAINDPRLNVRGPAMKQMLDKLRDLRISHYSTYIRGLRATALSVYNRPEDRSTIREDLQWLLQNHNEGAYSYNEVAKGSSRGDRGHWDNSNSQYGLLGVWSAAEVGHEVPRNYWIDVQKHWVENQHSSGQWGYRTPNGGDVRLSMTVAGLASLFVTHDWLDPAQFGAAVGREPFSPALGRGLAYLESGTNSVRVQGGYTLYGLERVGLASGFKYFGEHDWYRTLARQVIRLQGFDGSLGGSLQETCYCLLFLARGRHPILMNKLRYEGNWANRPRDAANLARFASRELERPFNWQVVPVTRDWTDWMDSPILYFASHKKVDFDEDTTAKLRRFIDSGGLLFTQADGGNAAFNDSVVAMAKRICTGFEFVDLPEDHILYSINFQISPKPKFKCITNGSRILWLHSQEDISQHWQLRADRTKRSIHEFGVNLFIYAAGKRDFRNRLASTVIPEPYGTPMYRIRLARIQYNGLWNPEPGAMDRFARWFRFETGYALDARVVAAAELDPQVYPIAHLTGAAITTFSDKDVAAMKKYVEAGGVLLIDACGGAWQFDQSAAALTKRLLGDSAMKTVDAEHPLVSGRIPGSRALPKPILRQYTEQKLGRSAGRLLWMELGQGRIVYSAMDITTGLLGTSTWGILGYKPEYAQDLMRNAVLWTADGAPAELTQP